MTTRLEPALALMLVDRCSWFELALRRHGFTSERLMALAQTVAQDGLRRRGATLGDRFDDLVSRLVKVGLEATLRYDPQQQHFAYGRNGGDPFKGYISDLMERRIDDYFRSRAEGFSDRRYKNYAEVTPTEGATEAAWHDRRSELELEEAIERLDSTANSDWYSAAAEAEGIALHDWVIRALNERASRTTTRPRQERRVRRELEQGPDHWPGSRQAGVA